MKLNKNSWHYRIWDKSFGNDFRPQTTDLCHYCHRVFWQLVYYAFLIFLVTMVIGTGVYALGYLVIYQGFILHTLLATLITVGIVATILVIGLYAYWFSEDGFQPPEPKTLVGKWWAARKQKVCPLIEFDEE